MMKLFNFAAHKAAKDTDAAFLSLIEKDIKARPASVEPITRSMRDRADAIEALITQSEEADRIEC